MPRATRYLSPSEIRLIADGVKEIFAVTTVRGDVDRERLQRALCALVRERPRLGATIERDGDGYVFCDQGARAPEIRVRRVALHTEINTPLERTRALVRVAILPDGAQSHVTLAIDHPIGDGRFIVATNARLWALYTGAPGDAAVPAAEDVVVEAPMEARLQGRFDEAELAESVARIAKTPPAAALAVRSDPGPDATRFEGARLDAETSGALFAVARAQSVSVHSLVCGVLMTVFRTRFDPAGAPHTIACDSPVDLRARLRPPLPNDVPGLCVGFATASVSTNGDEDVVHLARACQVQMDAARATSLPEKFLLVTAKLPMDIHNRTTMLVSNLGRLAVPPLPDELEFVDLQLVTTGTASPPFFFVTTLRGQLRLTLVYSEIHHDPARMRSLMTDIELALGGVART
ncbi:hypothetical protein LVJ94_47725 [Pendulispora rubella]|uniref:Phthiocerol/phthiodiolone dimycocerosyl transferase n=1 Tax=Pendulispora rubella TaxID=2741070 RepID=A0ABZ2L5R6_9BACT